MKFEVAALIAQIKAKIKEENDRVVKLNARERAKVAEKRQEWLDTHKADLVKFADKLKEKLRKDRPILHTDVPASFLRWRSKEWAEISLYREYEPHVFEPQTVELEALLAALKTVTSTEISPTAIRALGFKNLRDLF